MSKEWFNFLYDILCSKEMKALYRYLNKLSKEGVNVRPSIDNMFEAFTFMPPHKIRAVLIAPATQQNSGLALDLTGTKYPYSETGKFINAIKSYSEAHAKTETLKLKLWQHQKKKITLLQQRAKTDKALKRDLQDAMSQLLELENRLWLSEYFNKYHNTPRVMDKIACQGVLVLKNHLTSEDSMDQEEHLILWQPIIQNILETLAHTYGGLCYILWHPEYKIFTQNVGIISSSSQVICDPSDRGKMLLDCNDYLKEIHSNNISSILWNFAIKHLDD